MNAKVFVDTNVLVYSRDASEPQKQDQTNCWVCSPSGKNPKKTIIVEASGFRF